MSKVMALVVTPVCVSDLILYEASAAPTQMKGKQVKKKKSNGPSLWPILGPLLVTNYMWGPRQKVDLRIKILAFTLWKFDQS